PPTGGAWWEYQVFSAQVTIDPAPCPRSHSENLAGTLVPRPGLVSAEPSDHHTGVSSTTRTRRTLKTLWRRIHRRRRTWRGGSKETCAARRRGETAVCSIDTTLRNRPCGDVAGAPARRRD